VCRSSTWVSEKAPGLAVPIIKAFGGQVSEESGAEFDFEYRACISMVRIEVITDTYQGTQDQQDQRLGSGVVDWCDLGSGCRRRRVRRLGILVSASGQDECKGVSDFDPLANQSRLTSYSEAHMAQNRER
jgi:hypothetical protein